MIIKFLNKCLRSTNEEIYVFLFYLPWFAYKWKKNRSTNSIAAAQCTRKDKQSVESYSPFVPESAYEICSMQKKLRKKKSKATVWGQYLTICTVFDPPLFPLDNTFKDKVLAASLYFHLFEQDVLKFVLLKDEVPIAYMYFSLF
jgi:hypothetical protein